MALINAGYMVSSYTDDFGNIYTNIPVKFTDSVPIAVLTTTMGYAVRSSAIICGGNLPFTMRYLQAVFADGTSHQFPVATRADIAAKVIALGALTANKAVCINLVGEKWNVLPPKVTGTATFLTTPYGNISATGKKTRYTFDYASDVLAATTTLTLATSIETDPSALHDCQKAGMENAAAGSGGAICSIAGLGIKARHYIIQALAQKTGETLLRKVIRQSVVSKEAAADILAVISSIDGCAYCLGYKGETIANVHNFV